MIGTRTLLSIRDSGTVPQPQSDSARAHARPPLGARDESSSHLFLGRVFYPPNRMILKIQDQWGGL